jgi:hypothetical protein
MLRGERFLLRLVRIGLQQCTKFICGTSQFNAEQHSYLPWVLTECQEPFTVNISIERVEFVTISCQPALAQRRFDIELLLDIRYGFPNPLQTDIALP